MIVIDASAMVEVLLRSEPGRRIEERLLLNDNGLHAPHLLDIEVTHALRRQVFAGVIDEARAGIALAALDAFPLQRYPHGHLLPRIWVLRNNLSAYDATYVALAEVLDAPLLTRDARLAGAIGHGAEIELA